MIKKEITDLELKEFLSSLEPDKMHIFTMAEGRARGALFHGTRFVNQIRVQHNLGILESYILGQAALASALTIPMMKDTEHTVIRFEGDGSAQGYSIEADSSGYVRGYLFNENIPILKPLENWDLTEFLGKGTLTFSRIHKHDKFPQSSTVSVDSSNIAKDFAQYFAQSEQCNTAFNTSIQFDKQGRIIGAGAMFVQIMPKTGGTNKIGSQVDSRDQDNLEDEKLIQNIQNAFTACPSLGQIYSECRVDSEGIIVGLFREFNPKIAVQRDILFDCHCNKEYYENYVKNLPKEQIDSLKESGPNPLEIICRNCGSIYNISIDDL